jgi:hypothetical protein
LVTFFLAGQEKVTRCRAASGIIAVNNIAGGDTTVFGVAMV